ncbi:MAG: DEAD/DEAH box helicase [Candidatus Hydrogenedentes bacterium]|nr:DEAD/DEAH box helicase [Candidatus Hydrogenedentota bacterium]
MIRISVESGCLVLKACDDDLAPRHESQLAFWGFEFNPVTKLFRSPEGRAAELAVKVTAYLARCERPFVVEPPAEAFVLERRDADLKLQQCVDRGRQFKNAGLDYTSSTDFLTFLNARIPRKLKEHQCKAALHLLAVDNGANFSVPGSGKTTVVLSVFQHLRERGDLDALFVVGPPACFGPWRMEFEEVVGRPPSYVILAGGDVDDRRGKYQVNKDSVCELYLTSYQTLQRDWEQVRLLFKYQGIRFFFIMDEAHYIKQVNGAWATAALNVARYAEKRCILTGTPFPRSYSDAFNLFEVLWPESAPISERQKHKIQFLSQKGDFAEASMVLEEAVAPLFYRVRKEDLGLAAQRFHAPIEVEMHSYEKRVYDAILDKICHASQSDYFRDLEVTMRLRRGRIMRLRQCVSYTALLGTAIEDYSEDLLEGSHSLADVIRRYDELEVPGKLDALLGLVQDLRKQGEKVVIWSNFVRTLELIRDTIHKLGIGVGLIYGKTPAENVNVCEELSREGIIREFVRPDSGIDVLAANPAACAESISLHKTCSHAIYYDLSYNCAQYVQSLDRIHRVGGSEDKEAHYHFLQYRDSLDQDVFANLQGKAARMSKIIDQDYPIYSLDMFGDDEELEAYARLFGNT